MRYPTLPIPPRDELLWLNPTLIRRFKAKVDFGNFANNSCWRWVGSTTKVRGKSYYGTIGVKLADGYAVVKAHRVAVVLQEGELRTDHEVSHICETGLCVNPNHLACMGHEGHQKADKIAREIRGNAAPSWNIPHCKLWEGWELPEYDEIAKRKIQELMDVRAAAQAILEETDFDYRKVLFVPEFIEVQK